MVKLYFVFDYGKNILNLNHISLKKTKNLVIFIYSLLNKYLNNCIIKGNSIHLYISKENIFNVCYFLKYSSFFSCKQLIEFTVIDLLEMSIRNNNRFEFIYMLLSTTFNIRIFIRGFISIFDSLTSLSELFNSANWLEREVWDLYGIFFINHPNLRRILTDYGFIGYPFRKDFPLTGYVEVRYDDILKVVIVEPLELSQEFRLFKLETPWKVL